MKTIAVYTPQELKEYHPDAFETAYKKFADSVNEIFWADEILDSLKAIFKASGIKIIDYEIGVYYYSYIKFDMDDDIKNFSGSRAMAWIENNLFAGLREKRKFSARVKKFGREAYDSALYGKIPSCSLTGVCFDDDFLGALRDSIKDGNTLFNSYTWLADIAQKLYENELIHAQSEDEFLDSDWLEYTKDGKQL